MSTVWVDIGSHYTIGPCQDGEVFNILLSKQASNTTQVKRNFNLNKEYVSNSNRKNQIQRYLRTNHLLEWFSNQYSKSTFQKNLFHTLIGNRADLLLFILQGYRKWNMLINIGTITTHAPFFFFSF